MVFNFKNWIEAYRVMRTEPPAFLGIFAVSILLAISLQPWIHEKIASAAEPAQWSTAVEVAATAILTATVLVVLANISVRVCRKAWAWNVDRNSLARIKLLPSNARRALGCIIARVGTADEFEKVSVSNVEDLAGHGLLDYYHPDYEDEDLAYGELAKWVLDTFKRHPDVRLSLRRGKTID